MKKAILVLTIILIFLPSIVFAFFCPECGFENPDEAKFCMNCGKQIIIDEADELEQQKPENFSLPTLPEGHGAIVLFFVKNWPDRGGVPGHLNVYTIDGRKKEKIATLERVNYLKGGVMTTYNKQRQTIKVKGQSDNHGSSSSGVYYSGTSDSTAYVEYDEIVPIHEDVAIAQYYLVKELPEGEYCISVEKKLLVTRYAKEVRYKRFNNVPVNAGQFTVLHYYWQTNGKFGLNILRPQWFIDEANAIDNFFNTIVEKREISPSKIFELQDE